MLSRGIFSLALVAPPSGCGLVARRDSLGKPGLDFFLHPSHRPPAQAHRPGKCALRDAQINRAARQARAGFDCGTSQYRVRHLQPSLRESGLDETQGSWAIWAMKPRTSACRCAKSAEQINVLASEDISTQRHARRKHRQETL